MPKILDKFQPKTAVKWRKWQIDPMSDYGYGACPYCGRAGDSAGEDTNGDGTSSEYFDCEDCGIQYSYQTTIAHRFERIETDD
jgi:tRNA(Ile2) C34 agmatinyltransferase TiaS